MKLKTSPFLFGLQMYALAVTGYCFNLQSPSDRGLIDIFSHLIFFVFISGAGGFAIHFNQKRQNKREGQVRSS